MLLRFTKTFSLLLILVFTFNFSLVGCTSSESDDHSILEEELENLDNAEEDFADADGDDEDDGKLSDLDGEEEDDLVAELEDEELDEDGDDDDEDLDEEVASLDEDDDEDDFDKAFGDDEDDDEQALAKELGEGEEGGDYPEAESAEPAFPEEVVGQNGEAVAQTAPAPLDAGAPIITSQSQDIGDVVADIKDEDLPQHDLGKADPLVPEEASDEQSWVPVVKIKTDAFFRNERLLNAVYLARPGDTVQGISQKIYGADRSQTLLDDNGHLSKGIDPGDKVYYNSPSRPEDKSQVKVYYDDLGLQPQKYVTNKDDNMRRLGSKLLGFPEGWKEVWAINPNVDSKTVLPAGVEIRYWTGDEQSVQVMATVEEPPVGDPETEMSTPPTDMEPPPPVVSELPPEPPLPEASIAMPEESNFEPEILPEVEPFPDADISEVAGGGAPAQMATAQEGVDLLTVGAIALLVLAGVALVAIQIKNRKAQTEVTPPSLEYTQV